MLVTEILNHLSKEQWVSGRELRALVNDELSWFFRLSAPAFYWNMAYLEESGLVEAKYETRELSCGNSVRVRMYRWTPGSDK